MKIKELITNLPVRLARGLPDAEIAFIVEDSREARTGCLFIARSGTKADGRQFVADAVSRGAVAVLCNDASCVPSGIAALQSPDVADAAAKMAERFFNHPSNCLDLIGITGTNGKTTTAYLIRHLLNQSGVRCGLIGTVETDDGRTVSAANLTTPPPIELSRLMRAMVDHGCRACVMEASSHALHQKRTAGLSFRVGVFTNLTGDHLDYHSTMESYLDAKAILFESLPHDGHAVLNADDAAASKLAARSRGKVITCSMSGARADCTAIIGDQSIRHIDARFEGPWGSIQCPLPLIGIHNVANALQALAVCWVLGVDRSALEAGLTSCHAPPGRLQPVTSAEHDFAVLVDYAHTDDALENVLRALQPIARREGGRLRLVFGCGGDRDRTKRPRMAAVACRYADSVIITSDNPRTEDPRKIIEEIEGGIPQERRRQVRAIVDRAAAIEAAIQNVEAGDVLLIAGKGHEDYQIIGTTKRPFDDRLVAAEALRGVRPRVGAP